MDYNAFPLNVEGKDQISFLVASNGAESHAVVRSTTLFQLKGRVSEETVKSFADKAIQLKGSLPEQYVSADAVNDDLIEEFNNFFFDDIQPNLAEKNRLVRVGSLVEQPLAFVSGSHKQFTRLLQALGHAFEPEIYSKTCKFDISSGIDDHTPPRIHEPASSLTCWAPILRPIVQLILNENRPWGYVWKLKESSAHHPGYLLSSYSKRPHELSFDLAEISRSASARQILAGRKLIEDYIADKGLHLDARFWREHRETEVAA